MSAYACHECGRELPNGTAVLRSVSLTIRAWCSACYGVRFLGRSAPDPAVGGTLSQRLLRAIVTEKGGATGDPRKFLKVRG